MGLQWSGGERGGERDLWQSKWGSGGKLDRKFPAGTCWDCVVFQPQAPDDGTLAAEHEDNFSTPQLCA